MFDYVCEPVLFLPPLLGPIDRYFYRENARYHRVFLTKGWRQVAVFATEDVTALVFLMVNVASLGEGP